eukprot:5762103-Amphidinium_carterae.1
MMCPSQQLEHKLPEMHPPTFNFQLEHKLPQMHPPHPSVRDVVSRALLATCLEPTEGTKSIQAQSHVPFIMTSRLQNDVLSARPPCNTIVAT